MKPLPVTWPAAPGDRPPDLPQPSAEELKAIVPLGVTVAVMVATMFAGAATGEVLHRTSPRLAWVIATGMCCTLFWTTTIAGRQGPRRWSFIAVPGLAFFTFTYLAMVVPKLAPLLWRFGALAAFGGLILQMLGLAVSVVVPIAIVVAALREHIQRPPKTEQAPRSMAAPLLIKAGLAIGSIAVATGLIAAVLAVTRNREQVIVFSVLFTVVIATPAILWPLWATAYEWLMSRWRVDPPEELLDGLATLGSLIDFTFTRVLCLTASYGQGRVFEVVHRPGRSVLMVSESMARQLPPDELLAVLAHEAAHVRLRHAARKMLWGTLGGAVAILAMVAINQASFALLPVSLGFARVLVGLLPTMMLRQMYDQLIVRRHEREADAFAVEVVGAPAMLDALKRLGGGGPPSALVHRRWTTHGTREERAAGILASGGRRR